VTARAYILTAVCAVVLLLPQGQGRSQSVSARARIDSTIYSVGDRIHVKIDLHHTKGLSITPMVGDTLEGFAVLGRSGLQATSDTTSQSEFVLARYDSGDAAIPPIPFLFYIPNDTASHVALTNQLLVTIQTIPQDTSASYRDIKPTIDVPISWQEIALYAGIAILVGALCYMAWWWWKRRVRKLSGETYAPPPRPAHLVALEALGDLKAKKLWQQGLVKEYYSELTEIFRRYFEQRYTVPSLEETTDETLAGLRMAGIGDGLIQPAEVILRRADLVKFAKHHPTATEHEDSYRGVLSFVEKTKLTQMSPVVNEQFEAKSNVGS
jgi:hypothetical protein